MTIDGLKVLLVDDDALFREVLEKCLRSLGVKVHAAEAVLSAQLAVPVFEPDLILSDVQMPGGSGLELLEWSRIHHPHVPIVMMTGFSELVDATSAAEKGAAGFIAKPFKQGELQRILACARGNAGAFSVNNPSEKGDDDYMRVRVEDFVSGSQYRIPVYLRLEIRGAARFIKVAHEGEDLGMDRVRSYLEKGVSHLYLDRQDFANYVGLNVQLSREASRTSLISTEKKTQLLQTTMDLIQHQMFRSSISQESFDQAASVVELSVETLCGTEAGALVLASLKDFSDRIYTHATGVSMISALIARAVGWTAPKTLCKVALAGMLHDIGMKQLPPGLLEKPKSQMDAADLAIYETHSRRGMEILSDLKFVPSDVIQAVYQHHERGNGTGYPNRLSETKIYPLARLIAVAEEFCGLYLQSEDKSPTGLRSTLSQLLHFHAECLSPEFLRGLYCAFGVEIPEIIDRRPKVSA